MTSYHFPHFLLPSIKIAFYFFGRFLPVASFYPFISWLTLFLTISNWSFLSLVFLLLWVKNACSFSFAKTLTLSLVFCIFEYSYLPFSYQGFKFYELKSSFASEYFLCLVSIKGDTFQTALNIPWTDHSAKQCNLDINGSNLSGICFLIKSPHAQDSSPKIFNGNPLSPPFWRLHTIIV